MKPAARVQAAIEILDQVIQSSKQQGAAADTLIARFFAARRYAGSKDRRAIRELVYRAIRICGDLPPDGRAAIIALADRDHELAVLFDGSDHGPKPISLGENWQSENVIPAWMMAHFAEAVTSIELPAMLDRASLDIRANALSADRYSLAELFGGAAEILPRTSQGLRFQEAVSLEKSDAFENGLFEIQDEGSQIICDALPVVPGQLVIDLCAGAGGKTLSLAAKMENRGRIIAADVARERLARLSPRAKRAGVAIVSEMLLNPDRELAALNAYRGKADVVLIDAPCSGSGTWRRNPELRWRLTPERLAKIVGLQARLLDVGAALVRPGGTLAYVVCSVFADEGKAQYEAFAKRWPEWIYRQPNVTAGRPDGAGMLLTPGFDGTDGFFIAIAERPC